MTLAKAVRVPRDRAETVRRDLAQQNLLSRSLKPLRVNSHVLFPLEGDPGDIAEEVVSADFPDQKSRPRSFEDLAQVPETIRSQLPRSFDVVGSVVAIRLEEPLLPYREEIGRALLAFVPGVRTVAIDHGVQGVARIRSLEVIAGERTLVTSVKENGLTFTVDLGGVYFSPRLAREHGRVAALVEDGEKVLDIFCGFGPFGLTILRRNAHASVVSLDSNPRAIELLLLNARSLKVDQRLEAYCQDAAVFLEEERSFDRAIMNLPREGYKYLGKVGRRVKRHGRLHFYGLFLRDQRRTADQEVLSALSIPGVQNAWSLEESREVHPYSPSRSLMTFTLRKDGEI